MGHSVPFTFTDLCSQFSLSDTLAGSLCAALLLRLFAQRLIQTIKEDTGLLYQLAIVLQHVAQSINDCL
jgi:hypothetical protein